MTRVYTKTGDAGETSLYSGERVSKCCARVDAYGTVDELQASLGMARALAVHADVKLAIRELQETLVRAMAELATVGGNPHIIEEDVEGIERTIDRFASCLSAVASFQIPGDSAGSAALHVARTVARRSERAVLLSVERDQVPASPALLKFFNRVSDLCYVLARFEDEAER